MITIDLNGDLTVKVVEYRNEITGEFRFEEFRVSRKVLKDKSKVFRAMLDNPKFGEAAKSAIEVHEDHVESMRIWFLALHGADLIAATNVELEELWHIVAACGKYLLDITTLNKWFAAWYKEQTTTKTSISFARSSKYLVYNSIKYINEYNPTRFSDLHLPSRVSQQLNAAKGRLRSILFNDLFKPNDKLLTADCACKEMTLYSFEKRLYSIGEACGRCRDWDINEIVEEAGDRTRGYFEGLCLDCMDRSKPKLGKNIDMDYWNHNSKKEHEWISSKGDAKPCRVRHHQPSWYYSFMGRQQDRDHFAKEADALRMN